MLFSERYTRKRLKGGLTYWGGEHKFVTTRKAVKYHGLQDCKIKFPNFELFTEGIYRRLDSNGRFLNKYEIALKNEFEEYHKRIKQNKNYLNKILTSYANIKIKIRNKDKFTTEKLFRAGDLLSQLLLESTTYSKNISKVENEKWTEAGEPVMVCEIFNTDNSLELPKYSKEVIQLYNGEIKLYHYWLKTSGNNFIRVWLIILKSYDLWEEEFVRSLRPNLLRINAEKETLRILLRYIKVNEKNLSENDEAIKKKLRKYLKSITCKFLKIRYEAIRDDIIDTALSAQEKASSGELQSYRNSIEMLDDKYISENLDEMAQNGISIVLNKSEVGSINITEKGDIKNES
ncbi:MAG: hypothetical protein PVH88_09270 [Ignavibacteria bacterium]|jgi:hypothetical protein